MNILVLNAGSATLKYKLFAMPNEKLLADGSSDHAGDDDLVATAEGVIDQCQSLGIDAVGHRVVHGGPRFTLPTRMTEDSLQTLRSLKELDPLHNPTELALIEAGIAKLPNVPAIAVFDTAFHQTMPDVASHYALPWELSERLNLRRYGFHGISYQYVSRRLLECLGRTANGTKLIICHLGSGASICALQDGNSIDTSMGLTPLEGLVMGTRSGDIDPGLLLYLQREQHMSAPEIDNMLNHESGLKGLSGIGSDLRVVEKAASSGEHRASLALEIFAYRVKKYIGAYAAALGGLDALAFTGGVGEHSAQMRSRICRELGFLGVQIDDSRNTNAHEAAISADDAPTPVWVVPTDEERQIARQCYALLSQEPKLKPGEHKAEVLPALS